MRGQRVDDAHGISSPVPFAAMDMVQTNTYPADIPALHGVFFGPGDVAGGLAWDLGILAPGESTSFSIFKMAGPLAEVPLPATLYLVFGGLLALVARRR